MRLTSPHPSGHSQKQNKMFMTKRLPIAVLLVSIALFLAFLPSRVVQGRTAPRQQAVDPHVHTTVPANMIDGSVHPEMIQDKDAYRLFFLTVAADPTATAEVNRQRAFLSPILDESHLPAAQIILFDFKTRYQAAIAKYNASATAALANNTTPPDIGAFLSERDGIVLSAKTAMEKALGQKAWAQFDAHVQKEKLRMKVAVEDRR